jgi:hypothetical protein
MQSYLKNNPLVREELINYKLIYELKKAAAFDNYHLKTYLPSVDIEGYDLIIDDSNLLRKIQLKTKCDSKTARWEVHKSILLPAFSNFEDYGFHSTLCLNTPGCVFLLEVRFKNDDIELGYYYTDIDVLMLIALGFFYTTAGTATKAKELIRDLQNQIACAGKTTLIKGMFLKAKDAESLLDLAGFHSRMNKNIHYNMWQAIKNYYRPGPDVNTIKKRSIYINGHLQTIRQELDNLLAPGFRIKIKKVEEAFPHWKEFQ